MVLFYSKAPVDDHHACGQIVREIFEPFILRHNVDEADLKAVMNRFRKVDQPKLSPCQFPRNVYEARLGSYDAFGIVDRQPCITTLPADKFS